MSPEEIEAYKELLEEKRLESMDAALPKYEEGLKAAQQLKLGKNAWLDKMKERVGEINPASDALNIVVEEWVPGEAPTPVASTEQAGADIQAPSSRGGVAAVGDEDFTRSIRRIQNIVNMQISLEEKVKQLNRIEMEANRNIVMEEEKIKVLKEKM
jgi:hypothetical protein